MAELEQHPLQPLVDATQPYLAAIERLTQSFNAAVVIMNELKAENAMLLDAHNQLLVAAGLKPDDSIQFAAKEEQSEADAFMLQNDKDAIHATIKAIVEAGKHKQLPAIFAKNEMVGKNPSELINQCQEWQKLRALLNDLIAIKPKNG